MFHFVKFWSSLREKRAALFCPSQRKGKLENRQSCLFLLSPLSSLMGLGDGIRGMGEGKGFPLFEKVESFIIPRNWVFARKGTQAVLAPPPPPLPLLAPNFGGGETPHLACRRGMRGQCIFFPLLHGGQERLRYLFFQG